MHDETIDRTADASSPIASGTLADLSREQLDQVVLDGGERILDLTELIETSEVPLFIEVKVASAAEAVAELLSALPSDAPARSSTVISFHAEALEAIRREAPDTPVSYLVHQVSEEALRTALALGADGIGPSVDGLSLAAARAVHDAGLRLNPWTVNRPDQLAVALACGADSITTDDPAWVQLELDAREPETSFAGPAGR